MTRPVAGCRTASRPSIASNCSRHARVAPLVPLVDRQRHGVVEHRGDHVHERHLGQHGAPAVGPLAEDRPLQQAAGAQPPRRDPVGVDQPGGGDPVGDRDEVVERVLLGRQPAVEPPVPAALAAAPDVGVHEDDAAVEDRGQRLLPLALPGVLVGAVGPQQRGRRPVERGVAVPHDGGRHRRPVGAGKVRTSVTYAAGSWPGASSRCVSVTEPSASATSACTTGSVWDSSVTATAARRTRCCAPA